MTWASGMAIRWPAVSPVRRQAPPDTACETAQPAAQAAVRKSQSASQRIDI